MTIKLNNMHLSVAEFAAQFNKGQGKTTGATTGKGIDLMNTNIPDVVAGLSDSFRQFALSAYVWKNANYGNLEGDELEYLQNGYIGRNHYNSVESPEDKKAIATMLPHKVLTAEEYKRDNIELALRDSTFADVLPLITAIQNDKLTKSQLTELIAVFTNKLWPDDREAIYQEMLVREAEAKAKFQTLYDVGFTDINNTSGTFSASIDAATAKENDSITQLTRAGYVLTGTDFNVATMALFVTFKESGIKSDI
jgi:hypothetical protein